MENCFPNYALKKKFIKVKNFRKNKIKIYDEEEKEKLLEIITIEDIYNLINKEKIYKKKEKIVKILVNILRNINNLTWKINTNIGDDISILHHYIKYLKEKNEFILLLEVIYILFHDELKYINKTKFIHIFDYLQINYFFKNKNNDEYESNKNKYIKDYFLNYKVISNIEKIITKLYIFNPISINIPKECFFNVFSLLDNFTLYNFQKDVYINKFIDIEYLDFLENKNSKQKIKLICLVDSKDVKNIKNISYKYINEVYFESNIIENNFNNIYFVFKRFIKSLKYPENLEIISFDNNFFVERKFYNNKSLIDILLKTYKDKDSFHKKPSVFNEINLKHLILGEKNVRFTHQIFNAFNEMFPSLSLNK